MRLLSLVLSLVLISVAIEAKTLFFEAKDNKLCPDGKESCPDGATCCQLPDGTYGCCPYEDVSNSVNFKVTLYFSNIS